MSYLSSRKEGLGGLINAYSSLIGGCTKGEARFKCRRFLLVFGGFVGFFFLIGDGQTQDESAQRGCGVSIPEDTQNPLDKDLSNLLYLILLSTGGLDKMSCENFIQSQLFCDYCSRSVSEPLPGFH